MAVSMEEDTMQSLCVAGQHGRCHGCLECAAAQTLLSFTRSSNVVHGRCSPRPVSSVTRPSRPSTTVVRSVAEFDDRGSCGRSWAPSSCMPPPPQPLTPPPSDSDVGSQPSPSSSSWSDDGMDDADDMGIPPLMKRSRLLELLMSDQPLHPTQYRNTQPQSGPLDLRCNVASSAERLNRSQGISSGSPAVSRHRSQSMMPTNTDPTNCMSRVESTVVSSTIKRRYPACPATSTGDLGVTPAARKPYHPSSTSSGQSASFGSWQMPVAKNVGATSTACEAVSLVTEERSVTLVDDASAVLPAELGNAMRVVGSPMPVSPAKVADTEQVGRALASLLPAYSSAAAYNMRSAASPGSVGVIPSYEMSFADVADAACALSAQATPTSMPLVLTNINGMLVPLSSAPATIIVVNCPTVQPTAVPSSPKVAPAAPMTSGASSGTSRLCAIAPAPPASPSSNREASSINQSCSTVAVARARCDSSSAVQRKTYKCDEPECGKMYFKNSHLKVHKRVHTGEKPFACDWTDCSKKFARSDELSRHRRTHTGEKRYECPVCHQQFVRSDHLAKHSHRRSTCRASAAAAATQPRTARSAPAPDLHHVTAVINVA